MEKLTRKVELENTTDTGLGVGEFKLGHKESKRAFQCMKIIPKTEARLLWKIKTKNKKTT